MFRKVKVQGKDGSMVPIVKTDVNISRRRVLKERMQVNFNNDVYFKLKIAIKALSTKTPLFFEMTMHKLKLVKETFVVELGQGIECIIPDELSQDHLPKSFRYYDAIVPIVLENIVEVVRENTFA